MSSKRGFAIRTAGAFVLVSTLFVPFALGAAPAKDWPQFRGPLQSGASLGNGVLDGDAIGLEVVWKRALGSGYSSISVAGGRGVTMFTDGEDDYLTAFDIATGKELWRYRIAEMYAGHSGSDDGPISTPAIAGDTVYGLGPRGQLFAVGLADGREIWSRTLGEDDSTTPHYGFATVPVVVGDLLVVQTGGSDGHSISAFDAETGEPRWSTGDDPVNYQSPAVLELGGRRQVVAVNDKRLIGIEPETGEILWQHEHSTDALEGFAQPLALGGDRILLNSLSEVAAFQVSAENGGFEAEELWRSEGFKRSYAIPVLHDGHLFGFSSRFLTCIDAETGEVDWKSRPPGGQGLILIDGKLLIVSPEGDLVVAAAEAGEYTETARVSVFDEGGYTAPSFAAGRIYVRNLKELAAVRVTDKPAPAPAAETAPERRLLGEFGAFVERAEASDDTAKQVEEYLESQAGFPIVEPGGIVHFVYQGAVEDIAMVGNFLPFREEVVLDRIASTDVYFKSFELDPEAVWEYRFSVNFGEPTPDPGNPLTIGSFFGPMSVLRMPKFEAPDFSGEPEGPPGRMDSFQFRSEILDGERRIRVYVPAGYATTDERYPLLFVNLANLALDQGKLDGVLDHLIAGGRMAPVLAVFVSAQGDYESPRSADHVRMLTEEIIPHLDKHYRTRTDPASRGIVGAISGGTMSIYAAVKAPGAFGKVAAQSLFLRPPFKDELLAAVEASEPASWSGVVEWRRHDLVVGEVIDAAAGSRQVYEALKAKGFDVRSREVAGSWGWSSWRAELGHILESFYPPSDAE